MTDKVKIKAIIKQYADKGERLLEEAYENGEHASTTGYWDGYGDCANLLLRELDDMQEEPESHKPKITLGEATGKLKELLDNKAIDKCLYGKESELVDDGDLPNKEEEPVSEIDFEQELYKYFGQVKDFTLGMRIAKRFYEIGRNHQEPVSEDLEEAAEMFIDSLIPTEVDTVTPFAAEYVIELLNKAIKFGANWQKEQFEKERLKHCDALTEEQAQIESDFVTQHIQENNRIPTFLDAIEYGMNLQKEQLMTKAVDGNITFDYYGDDDKTYGCIAHDSFCLEDFGLKDMDKVKVIVIKED